MFILNLFKLFFIIIFVDSVLMRLSLSLEEVRHIYNGSFQTPNNSDIFVPRIVYKKTTGKRKFEEKCDEYVDAVKTKIWMLHPSELKPFSISIPCKPSVNLLISGGEPVRHGDFRHMAAIGWRRYDESIEYLCGGSLLSENWVLTAAHCTQHYLKGEPSVVRLGSVYLNDKLGVVIEISKMICHPEYKQPKLYSDIALLKLSKSVSFGPNIQPACLSSKFYGTSNAIWATGWGQTSFNNNGSDILLKARLDIIDNTKCALAFKNSFVIPDGFSLNMLCAGDSRDKEKKDTCTGDSGGPLQAPHPSYCLYEILGITSFGKLCAISEDPAVYIRISSYIDWIEEIVWP